MKRIREILRYKHELGLSHERIALALEVSKGSVHNVVRRFEQSSFQWPLPADLSDSALDEALYGSNENAEGVLVLPDVAYLEDELHKPHVTLQLLYEEYRAAQLHGLGRTAFYEYFSRHRRRKVDMKMIHKGGDKVFIDYSGDGLSYVDRSTGEIVPVELFVCSWGASSYSYSDARQTQRTEDFIPSNVAAFEYFKAVPHALVPDNLKSGIKKPCRYDPEANPLYRKMAEHYATVILPARVGKPQDKAVVESNVLHVQRYILGRLRNRTFYSLHEINDAIRELLEEYNNRPMKDYGGQSRRERFEALDRPFAKPLPAQRFMITRMKQNVRVAPNYHLRFEDHYYSVPFSLARKYVDVFQIGGIIEIYHDNRHVCRHKVGMRKYAYTTDPAHMPAEHRFVRGWSKEWFLSEATKIGPSVAEAIRITMERQKHVEQGYNAALGILRFAKAYSPQRLENACLRALHFKSASYRCVKAILEQRLDEEPLQLSAIPAGETIVHDNIRGPEYYANQREEYTHA